MRFIQRAKRNLDGTGPTSSSSSREKGSCGKIEATEASASFPSHQNMYGMPPVANNRAIRRSVNLSVHLSIIMKPSPPGLSKHLHSPMGDGKTRTNRVKARVLVTLVIRLEGCEWRSLSHPAPLKPWLWLEHFWHGG